MSHLEPLWPIGLSALMAIRVLLGGGEAGRAVEQLPDLQALPPTEISLDVSDDGRYLLRFTQGFANVGSGPLQVRGVQVSADLAEGYQEILDEEGQVVRQVRAPSVRFHPHHKHWHADDVAAYELRQGSPQGPVVARNGKVSYCFVDDHPLPGYEGGDHSPHYLNCKTSTMGITPGWVDVYEASLYDQWVDVTAVPDGVYYLVITADPGGMYLEATRDNNTAWVKVELIKADQRVRVIEEGITRRGASGV